ncbi:hypothetical protein FNV43_RR13249 [Rhamnella rubrinervis]|uniref:Uncharacterized protein n=1 Tax=Rhamnella rubrinervis TaxID=2594499 RepID=A0A8K0H0R6_9ROSA|nr:hypothetical protein FNV43_RR13249 [Rhamnella rubrinervis]
MVPLFNYLHAPKFQLIRVPALDSNTNGELLGERSGLSENGSLSCRSNPGSLDSTTDSGAAVAEPHNGVAETGWNGLQMPIETTKGYVNNSDSQKAQAQLEIFFYSPWRFINSVNTAGWNVEKADDEPYKALTVMQVKRSEFTSTSGSL